MKSESRSPKPTCDPDHLLAISHCCSLFFCDNSCFFNCKGKEMPKVRVVYCFCVHPDCEWSAFYACTTGRPSECKLCGGPTGANDPEMVNPEEVDQILRDAAKARPAWNAGRQTEIRNRSTSIGGTISCALCEKPILVNSDGKEEWISKSGNLHATLPHTDHVDPWVDRQSSLYASSAYAAADENEKKAMEREAFNASPLQTAHMSCNCMKGKN